ncbi:nitrite reductase small subunit NirD [Amaricoccus macauensis]|uniref:nitrite reductase small subunit NirD n=1 Tax=Amaricoccus macauensis TaxID=57001 RepID=UPI003C7BC0CB
MNAITDISADDWIDVGSVEDIPVRGARVVKTPRGCIAVFRNSENEVFALNDRCPHKGGPLSQGIVHGRNVTCPLHNFVISLETGEAQGADEGQVTRFDIRVEADRILLDPSALGA